MSHFTLKIRYYRWVFKEQAIAKSVSNDVSGATRMCSTLYIVCCVIRVQIKEKKNLMGNNGMRRIKADINTARQSDRSVQGIGRARKIHTNRILVRSTWKWYYLQMLGC